MVLNDDHIRKILHYLTEICRIGFKKNKQTTMCDFASKKAIVSTGLNLESCTAIWLMNFLLLQLVFGKLSEPWINYCKGGKFHFTKVRLQFYLWGGGGEIAFWDVAFPSMIWELVTIPWKQLLFCCFRRRTNNFSPAHTSQRISKGLQHSEIVLLIL